MTLATADEAGLLRASPVWYATADYREFFWVSSPQARHSLNVAARPAGRDRHLRLAGAGRRRAGRVHRRRRRELTGDEVDNGVEIFSHRSRAQGLPEWTRDDVRAPARHRIYRATAFEHSVLTAGDERVAVRLE
jgi:hypothetical protein